MGSLQISLSTGSDALKHNSCRISVAFIPVRLYILLSDVKGAFNARTGKRCLWV
jgi:hypothetical protein